MRDDEAVEEARRRDLLAAQERTTTAVGVPLELAAEHPLRVLHTHLSESPFLQRGSVVVCRPPRRRLGPPLPLRLPHGRRNRGGTYAGQGVGDDELGNVWEWVVIATVKEGTEGKGAIEAVLRDARSFLRRSCADVALPATSFARRQGGDGWGVLDAGEFAVHVVSVAGRALWFGADSEGSDAGR